MIPGIVYSWSRTIPLDELEMYQFLLSYQLPLRSKGRPGYRCNFELIHMGLCELRVKKSLVDFLYPFIFPK